MQIQDLSMSSVIFFQDLTFLMDQSFRHENNKCLDLSRPEGDFTLCKQEIKETFMTHNNPIQEAKEAGLPPVVTVLPTGKRGPLDRGIEKELLDWMSLHQGEMTSTIIRGQASRLFQRKYPSFKASRGWYYNFLKRHKIPRIFASQ